MHYFSTVYSRRTAKLALDISLPILVQRDFLIFLVNVLVSMYMPVILQVNRIGVITGLKIIYIYIYIQGVTGGTDQTSGGCSLC